jgi:lipocalin-like protein
MKSITIRERLIGTWRLISFELRAEDGAVSYPFGLDPKGFLIYADDNFIACQLMEPGRPNYPAFSFDNVGIVQLAAAARGYLAYCGLFEVDESAKEVHHHVQVSLTPNWIGDRQTRRINFIGEQLELSTPEMEISGQMQTGRVLWEKVKLTAKQAEISY